jgi:hypothetical protein
MSPSQVAVGKIRNKKRKKGENATDGKRDAKIVEKEKIYLT